MPGEVQSSLRLDKLNWHVTDRSQIVMHIVVGDDQARERVLRNKTRYGCSSSELIQRQRLYSTGPRYLAKEEVHFVIHSKDLPIQVHDIGKLDMIVRLRHLVSWREL